MNLSMEYVAGFFDGEGCIGIYRNKGSKSDRYKSGFKTASWVRQITVVNTYRPFLVELQKVFCGGITQIVKKRGFKPCYQWRLGAKNEMLAFLNMVYYRLNEKRPQANVMIRELMGQISTADAAAQLRRMKRSSYAA